MKDKEGSCSIDVARENIGKAFNILGIAAKEVVNSLGCLIKELMNIVYVFPEEKQRLPRKLKKKYKKLGIYEDWKDGKL